MQSLPGGIVTMAAHPSFPSAELESVCRVLADTDNGLSGSEMGRLLAQQGIADPAPDLTKWKRLSLALSQQQQRDGCGNRIVSFILEAMKPVRYVGKTEVFEARRVELNRVLIFTGLELGKDGQLRPREAAKTLTEAEQRAGRLRAELLKRNVHPDVLRFCHAEWLQENCFHAVLEATKSVADKIRTKTGLRTAPKTAGTCRRNSSEGQRHYGRTSPVKIARNYERGTCPRQNSGANSSPPDIFPAFVQTKPFSATFISNCAIQNRPRLLEWNAPLLRDFLKKLLTLNFSLRRDEPVQ